MRPGSLARRVVVGPAASTLLPRFGWVLDLGGFDGAVAEVVPRLGPRVVVVDLDVSGLRTAQRRGLYAVSASAEVLPFPDASFDAVLCFDLLPALPMAVEEPALREIRRLLKVDGHLFLTTLDSSFRLPFASREETDRVWHARNGMSWPRLRDLLAGSGFQIVERHGYYGFLTRLFYALCFFRNLPPRGTRLKRRVFSALVAAERWICLRPQAHFVVARTASDTAAFV